MASTADVVPAYVQQYQRVDSYAEIQEIMRSPDFHQGRTPEREVFFGDTLIMIDGDEHLQRKRRLSPLFSREAMGYYEARLLDPTIADVLADLRSRHAGERVVRLDFVPLIRSMLHRISAQITGVDGVDTTERTERFCRLVEKLGHAVTAQFSRGNRQEVVQEGMVTLKALVEEYLQSSLDRRRVLVRQFKGGTLAKEDLPRDVLTMICLDGSDARTRSDDTAYYAYVWRECALFLHASTSTTVHTFPHVIVHLSHWLAQHPEDRQKLTQPAFLRAAIGESLRLHQTSPVKFRTANKDVILSTGRKVAKDEMLALYAPPANMEPELFGPHADRFDVHRERPGNMAAWGLTFGSGAHMCIGRTLVTGHFNRADDQSGTEGTMVKIMRALYAVGLQLDPDNPPRRVTDTYHDAYASLPIKLTL